MDKLKEILNEIKDLNTRLNKLWESEDVKLYLELLKSKETLMNMHSKTLKEIQENCKHKIWYKIKEVTDNYEGRTYYTCKCLDCAKVVENRDKDFEGKIIDSKATYEEVKSIHNQLIK